jgi:hypothetical protein
MNLLHGNDKSVTVHNTCSKILPADTVCDPWSPHYGAKCQIGSDYHGVDQILQSKLQIQGFTKYALIIPEGPVGLIYHIFRLCLPCQSLVQNGSKIFDLTSQLQFISKRQFIPLGPLNLSFL